MADFASTLKKIRLERGMSLEEFATFLGTSKQNISRYENGEVTPKISTAARIARKLGITLAQLNGDDASPADATDNPWALRDELLNDPDRQTLLKLARHGSAEDVRQVAAIISALRATNPEFYDGDDPA